MSKTKNPYVSLPFSKEVCNDDLQLGRLQSKGQMSRHGREPRVCEFGKEEIEDANDSGGTNRKVRTIKSVIIDKIQFSF